MKKVPPKMRNMPQQELNTVRALRSIVIRMQTAGLTFLLVGALMPKIAPYYAEKDWKLLIGGTVSLPRALMAFGCVILMVSIFCFIRSYRCPKCGGLISLTPYQAAKKCRHCGVKIKETDTLKKKEL